jgi:hypothetical protein
MKRVNRRLSLGIGVILTAADAYALCIYDVNPVLTVTNAVATGMLGQSIFGALRTRTFTCSEKGCDLKAEVPSGSPGVAEVRAYMADHARH